MHPTSKLCDMTHFYEVQIYYFPDSQQYFMLLILLLRGEISFIFAFSAFIFQLNRCRLRVVVDVDGLR